MLEYALSSNALIWSWGGEFRFAPDGPAIPHLTMLMGDVSSAEDLAALDAVCASFASSIGPQGFTLTAPFFKDARNRYVFVNVNEQERFRSLRGSLQSKIGSLVDIDHYGGASNPSHITLGYLPSGGALEMLGDLPAWSGLRGESATLQLAITGPRGTCVEAIQTYPLVAE